MNVRGDVREVLQTLVKNAGRVFRVLYNAVTVP